MATRLGDSAHTMTKAERANQRNAVLAGFLGWTLDAFDFFVLTFVIQDVATAFGKSRNTARPTGVCSPSIQNRPQMVSTAKGRW